MTVPFPLDLVVREGSEAESMMEGETRVKGTECAKVLGQQKLSSQELQSEMARVLGARKREKRRPDR